MNFDGLDTQAPILKIESSFGRPEISVSVIFLIVSKFKVSGFKSFTIDDRSR